MFIRVFWHSCRSLLALTASAWHPRRSLLALTLLALTACVQPAPPVDQFHRLEVTTPAAALPRPVLPGVLEINRPDAESMLAERGLAYVDPDGSLSRYRYDLWSDPPPTMLQQALFESLRRVRVADQVVTPDLRVPPDWALRGRLIRFDYLPSQSKVAVKLQLSVISARDGSLVLLETYAAELPSGMGPEAAAAAMGRATSQILAQFVSDLGHANIPVQRR